MIGQVPCPMLPAFPAARMRDVGTRRPLPHARSRTAIGDRPTDRSTDGPARPSPVSECSTDGPDPRRIRFGAVRPCHNRRSGCSAACQQSLLAADPASAPVQTGATRLIPDEPNKSNRPWTLDAVFSAACCRISRRHAAPGSPEADNPLPTSWLATTPRLPRPPQTSQSPASNPGQPTPGLLRPSSIDPSSLPAFPGYVT